MVSRKYKNFCELHQILISTFPGFSFPAESKILINSFNDFNSLQDLRKPKIIDERKLALEFYLKEISKSPEIRNTSVFKMFIGVEGNHVRSLSNDFLEDNIPEDGKHLHFLKNKNKIFNHYICLFNLFLFVCLKKPFLLP
jgi:PX domain